MKELTFILIIFIIIQVYRVAIIFFIRKQYLIKKIFEVFILLLIIIIELLNMHYIDNNKFNTILFFISIILALYIGINIIYERIIKKESLSILSVKNAIDLSDNGIMFLNDKGNIILINVVMKDILKEYNINDNYIDNLKEKEIKEIHNEHILKCLNRVWQLKINNNKEIIALDITDIYKIQEKTRNQNIEIEENNKKILKTLNNIEEVEKEKKLIKIKNEFHDILGHRLSLFGEYLKQDNINKEEIKFMLDNLFEQFTTLKSPEENLKKLIEVYKVFNINISIIGKLPKNKEVGETFFEIIREAVTNAIIHANSKNIKVVITNSLDKTEMLITNDGIKPKKFINENEGIKGMRRKLKEIGGILIIESEDEFILKIII